MRAGAGEGNVRIWGTSPESIDEAEDRDKWYKILTRLDIKQPPGDMVVSEQQALTVAQKLGYPVMVRPRVFHAVVNAWFSFAAGRRVGSGRAMAKLALSRFLPCLVTSP